MMILYRTESVVYNTQIITLSNFLGAMFQIHCVETTGPVTEI